MSRDQLRSKIFSEKVKIDLITLDDGQEIEVRQPSVGLLLDVVGIENLKDRMTRMLIESCFVPGTNEKVFEDADRDSLMSLPQGSGGAYQKLIDAIQENMNLPGKVERAVTD